MINASKLLEEFNECKVKNSGLNELDSKTNIYIASLLETMLASSLQRQEVDRAAKAVPLRRLTPTEPQYKKRIALALAPVIREMAIAKRSGAATVTLKADSLKEIQSLWDAVWGRDDKDQG